VLLGAQWDAAVPYLRLLGVAAFFGAFTRITQWVLISSGSTARLLRWWLLVQTPVLLAAVLAGSLYGPRGVAIGFTVATVALAAPSIVWCVAGTPLTLGVFLRAVARPAAAALGAALVLVAATPFLPTEPGGARLASALLLYAISFVAAWLAAPGGSAAARELLVAIRELKLRSGS
jgi:O-antigen/teichoic acid export membrane protein